MASVKICSKCDFEGESSSNRCPTCGRLLRSKTVIRVSGALMALLGGFLMAMMGGLTFWALGAYQTGTTNSARFTGTPEQFRMIIGLFGLIFIFGLASLIGGLWQLVFGRRKMIIVWVIVGLGVLLIIAGIALTRTL